MPPYTPSAWTGQGNKRVYLNDVDENSGPRVFIPESHRTEDSSKRGGAAQRFNDDELEDAGLLDRAIHFTGPFDDLSRRHVGPTRGHAVNRQIKAAHTDPLHHCAISIHAREKRQADISGYDPYVNALSTGR